MATEETSARLNKTKQIIGRAQPQPHPQHADVLLETNLLSVVHLELEWPIITIIGLFRLIPEAHISDRSFFLVGRKVYY